MSVAAPISTALSAEVQSESTAFLTHFDALLDPRLTQGRRMGR